jgi:hypothetical protein
LRFCLEHEVLWRAAAENEYARRLSARFCRVDDRSRLVHVAVDIEKQLESRSAMAAIFIPIEESPGDEVKIGTP